MQVVPEGGCELGGSTLWRRWGPHSSRRRALHLLFVAALIAIAVCRLRTFQQYTVLL